MCERAPRLSFTRTGRRRGGREAARRVFIGVETKEPFYPPFLQVTRVQPQESAAALSLTPRPISPQATWTPNRSTRTRLPGESAGEQAQEELNGPF